MIDIGRDREKQWLNVIIHYSVDDDVEGHSTINIPRVYIYIIMKLLLLFLFT